MVAADEFESTEEGDDGGVVETTEEATDFRRRCRLVIFAVATDFESLEEFVIEDGTAIAVVVVAAALTTFS